MSDKRQPKNSQNYAAALTGKYLLPTSLTAIGATLTTLAYALLQSTPLTALGISTILIATVAFAVERGQPKIPTQASAILLQTGVENTAALVEEIGLKSKAIYLPASITGDKPKALIPLEPVSSIRKKVLPKRLIVKYGAKPNEIGLLLITPGSTVGEIFEANPECSAGDIESAISQVLVGMIGLANGVKVHMDNGRVLVEISNPRLENKKMWIYENVGTPIASIAASIAAQILNQPVTVAQETCAKDKNIVELQILESET
ncbi:MAG: hypothetical protein ACQCN4_01735 [Candidatus Bathyarchaeia archaeon]|jgi:hypothetical protein